MDYYLVLALIFFILALLYGLYLILIYVGTDGRYHLYKRFKPFPKAYKKVLLEHFPFYAKLPRSLQRRLEACILVFIKEKEFIGRGIEVDEAKKVLIAANACLLTVGHDRCEYKHVKSIYVYPEAVFKKERIQNGWIVTEEGQVLLGEAWQGGEVVLSWRDLVAGDENPNDGKNVGLHEFAHQLDMEDGIADGTPPMPLRNYKHWTKVMRREFHKLQELYKKHKKGFLDYYALTNAAEFFAVATEAFFEKPKQLQRKEPELYEALKEYYRLDPASW